MIDVCTTYYDPELKQQSSLHLSAKRLGVSVINFGPTTPFTTFAETKLVELKKFCEKSIADMVLFLDGNDTILMDKPEDIIKTWEELCGGRVAIGSEKVCWPYQHLKDALVERHAKAGGGMFAFLDTGFILGKRQDVIEMLGVVIDSIPKYREAMPDATPDIIGDDVGMFALNICDGTIDPYVDYNTRFIVALKNIPVESVDLRRSHVLHCNGHRNRDRKKLHALSVKLLGAKVEKRIKAK